MFSIARKSIGRIALVALVALVALAALALGSYAPAVFAQEQPRADEQRLLADATAAFRQGRFPEAYGRFVVLANAGHAPSAEVALWMYRYGPSLFGSTWDASPEQLASWTQLAGLPALPPDGRSRPLLLPSRAANASDVETGT